MKNNTRALFLVASMLITSNAISAESLQHNLRVDGITCPFCVATSAKALQKIEGVSHVNADIKAGVISVCADEKTDLNDEKLTQLFLDKGFTYQGKETLQGCETE